ncbi:hypothetical protein B0T10DRAFT_566934 [Thelonectria olida]|uniref:NACHT domain-containing protein n=1 Tax=Thelonectria olida TaxID=1576542 RepID=A0A9P9AK21_9HYPO|nr:hypothetical protein B0T10DRAFT_566934 [Thelonectria olida]
MSGLEPLAALGLACNISQLIETAAESASLCKRIYNTGRPDPDLDDFAKNLSETSASLKKCLDATQGPIDSEDRRLLDLARKCQDVAGDLKQEMDLLTIPPGQNWALWVTLKSVMKKSKLDRLEKKLKDAERLMETQLLVGMHKRLDISADQIKGLDDKLEHFIDRWSAGENKLSRLVLKEINDVKVQLSNEVRLAETSTKAHLTTETLRNRHEINEYVDGAADAIQREIQDRADILKKDELYERFLVSLHYDEMHARQNDISSTCPGTFSWIFGQMDTESDQDPDEDCGYRPGYPITGFEEQSNSVSIVDNEPNPGTYDNRSSGSSHHSLATQSSPEYIIWDSFVEWLQSDNPFYWVSGKPASGKSVLMKFIMSHSQTIDALKSWQPEVRIFSHFFWKPGTMMQQNLKGLLCSLIYQMFDQDRPFAMACLQEKPEWRRKKSPADWDVVDLRHLLTEYLGQSARAVCIFIDGLDEFWYKDGVDDLIHLLEQLRDQSPLVKMCVSSRPEHALESRFGRSLHLRMQDLTRRDIQRIAETTLVKAMGHGRNSMLISQLVYSIIDMADGVILWAVLVARSLARGIASGDSEDELEQRLSSMPRDLYSLFRDMWERLDEDAEIYQNTSALFFNIVSFIGHSDNVFQWFPIIGHRISVFELMAASSDDVLDRYLVHGETMTSSDLERRCQRTRAMVAVRSAGLLEVTGGTINKERLDPSLPNSAVLPYTNMLVQLVHRTALDFLIDTEDGRQDAWSETVSGLPSSHSDLATNLAWLLNLNSGDGVKSQLLLKVTA